MTSETEKRMHVKLKQNACKSETKWQVKYKCKLSHMREQAKPDYGYGTEKQVDEMDKKDWEKQVADKYYNGFRSKILQRFWW